MPFTFFKKRRPAVLTTSQILDRSRHRHASGSIHSGAQEVEATTKALIRQQEERAIQRDAELPWSKSGILLWLLKKALPIGYAPEMYFVQGYIVQLLIRGPKRADGTALKFGQAYSEERLRDLIPAQECELILRELKESL